MNCYHPEEILSIIDKIEKKNPEYNGLTFSTRQYFFVDPMIPYNNGKPGVGNKFAFETFIKKSKPGYYISMDANDFKKINKISHIHGDLAIKSIGNTLRNATISGMQKCKLFRSGGDEFLLYSETKEHLIQFVENAIKEFDQIEFVDTIGDVIKITLSFGIGNSYADAENALSQAKNKKTGTPKHLIHSNLIGEPDFSKFVSMY